jgi:hypothetical protein
MRTYKVTYWRASDVARVNLNNPHETRKLKKYTTEVEAGTKKAALQKAGEIRGRHVLKAIDVAAEKAKAEKLPNDSAALRSIRVVREPGTASREAQLKRSRKATEAIAALDNFKPTKKELKAIAKAGVKRGMPVIDPLGTALGGTTSEELKQLDPQEIARVGEDLVAASSTYAVRPALSTQEVDDIGSAVRETKVTRGLVERVPNYELNGFGVFTPDSEDSESLEFIPGLSAELGRIEAELNEMDDEFASSTDNLSADSDPQTLTWSDVRRIVSSEAFIAAMALTFAGIGFITAIASKPISNYFLFASILFVLAFLGKRLKRR